MTKPVLITELISQRRIWAAIIGIAGSIFFMFGVEISNQDTLIDLLTNLGSSFTPLIAAVLALHSYFYPKK